jgi:hypothetical protein
MSLSLLLWIQQATISHGKPLHLASTAASCILYDVAIIDENDIWVVGEINIE